MEMPINKEHSIMAIINITPDSFYKKSRCLDKTALQKQLNILKKEDIDILDIGAFSSRPNCNFISKEEELNRIIPALQIIKTTILTKICRNKEIEDNDGKTLVSEGVDGNYFDMVNYAVFGLIKKNEEKNNKKA